MRNAYAILGILFIIVAVGAWYAFSRPTPRLPDNSSATTSMKLESSAFGDGATIPSRYTCDGETGSPPVTISDVPKNALSVVLLMDDPDVPKAVKPDGVFDHWVLFNILTTTTIIAEGGSAGVRGNNGAGKLGYTGPCPPPQYEPSEHRYMFVLYALDSELALKEGTTKQQVLDAIEGHVLAHAQLMGRYKRVAQQ